MVWSLHLRERGPAAAPTARSEWGDNVMTISAMEGVGVASDRARSMTREEKKVILASSAGTIFEWYDSYLYGALAATIGAQFFAPFPEAARNVFALLAFAAGFLVRPFGALMFGR